MGFYLPCQQAHPNSQVPLLPESSLATTQKRPLISQVTLHCRNGPAVHLLEIHGGLGEGLAAHQPRPSGHRVNTRPNHS